MTLEQEALSLVARFMDLYVCQRRPDALLPLLDPCVSLIGAKAPRTMGETAQALVCERKDFPKECRVAAHSLETAPMGAEGCVVFGEITARAQESGADQLRIRLSAVCRRETESQTLKIVHLHLSRPDAVRENEELRLSLERHQVIMNQTTDIIFEWDIRADRLIFSANWYKKFGYEPLQERISEQIPRSENIHPDDMDAFMRIMRDTARGVPYSETEFRIRDIMGTFTWCRIRATTQYGADETAVKAVGVIVDIDADKKQRMMLVEQAQRDALTGLFNKTATKMQVERRLTDSAQGAMLMIDLDNFKSVNDRFGHLCGDGVLSDTADELRRLFRFTDVAGRIGGDEFLVYLPGLSREGAAERAREVIDALGRIRIRGGNGLISCSVGIATYPDDARSFYGLYHCADNALYHVKNTGKSGWAAYAARCCPDPLPGGIPRSAVGTAIDSDAATAGEHLARYGFEMLYSAVDIQAAVRQLMETAGRACGVSRVCIFENSRDGRCCSNTFEWCADGVPSANKQLQNLSCQDDLGDYPRNFDENGIFYCRDIRRGHPALYRILEPLGVISLLDCAIMDDGRFKGFIRFDDCRENRRWTRDQMNSLSLAAKVLSVFLIKLRLKESVARLETDAKAYEND